MTFFKKDIIDSFLSKLSISGIKILANNEIDEQPLRENGVSVCRRSILDDYLTETLDNAFGDNDSFEIIALFEDGSLPISFLVVEKGECSKLSGAWSVNLICAALQSPKGLKGLGQILMGLYLYTIAENEEVQEKVGVLELANGYINAGGLASYSKLGFVIDDSLYGEDCFPNYNNLPMIARDINPDRVIDILNNVPDSAYSKEPICLIGDRDIQLYAGICLNLVTFMTLVPEAERKEYIRYYELNYGPDDTRIVDYKYLYSLIKKDPDAFKELVVNIENGSRTDSENFPGFSKLHTRLFTKEPVTTTAVSSVKPVEEALDRKSRASRASRTHATPAVEAPANKPSRPSRGSKTPVEKLLVDLGLAAPGRTSRVSRQQHPVHRPATATMAARLTVKKRNPFSASEANAALQQNLMSSTRSSNRINKMPTIVSKSSSKARGLNKNKKKNKTKKHTIKKTRKTRNNK
jgi:hypothetical protein